MTKGIRGAITVDDNTKEDIKNGTLTLLNELINKNNIDKNMISHVIFTVTKDLTAEFPAKFARIDLGWDNVAMMCFNEADIENSLQKCIRVLVVLNCMEDFVPQYVYLNGAKDLRK
ncbi:chorismate mutase [bacterium]|nr:chorismate mutase [bacterium]